MKSEQLSNALASAKTPEDCTQLIRAAACRRDEIRARLQAIGNERFGSEVRTAALTQGPAALKAIDDEIAELECEERWLNSFEAKVYTQREAILDAQAVKEIPAARKQLPTAMRKVRDALAGLDSTIAALNAVVETIGNYGRLPDAELPLTDDELGELFELRDQVWRTRKVAVLTPPVNVDDIDGAIKRWPRSLPRMYIINESLVTRNTPDRVPVIDISLRRRNPPCCANESGRA